MTASTTPKKDDTIVLPTTETPSVDKKGEAVKAPAANSDKK